MRLLPFAVSFAAATAACVAPAAARPGGQPSASADTDDARAEDIARSFFGKPPGKAAAFACFERIYDAPHLTRHPLQKVGSMLLLMRGEMIPEDPVPNYDFSLAMTYRNQSARFVSNGYCGHASAAAAGGAALKCGVDCDGGALEVGLSGDAKSTLLSLERIAVWPEGTAAEETYLEAGADDRSFRLQRVALSRCVTLTKDAAEAAALK